MAGDEDGGGNVGEEKEWCSVADPGCLSRIPDLGSRIQKQEQKRGVKQIVVIPVFVATNFTKL